MHWLIISFVRSLESNQNQIIDLFQCSAAVSSMGSRRADQHPSLLAVLLSQHRRHYFCGRQRRFGAHAGRQGGTDRHAGRGRAEGIHPVGLCQQAGPEGCHERPTNQRRPRITGDPKPAVVHPGNLGVEGKGLVRGI